MTKSERSAGRLFVNLLGGFAVAGPRAGTPLPLERRKTVALVAALALDPGRMVPRGKLTALLWDEQNDAAARHGLRQCLLDLRQALAQARIAAVRTEGDLIGLDPATVVVDVTRFERRLARGTPEALEEAVALYRGDLLEGFSINGGTFEDWLAIERDRLRSQAIGVLRKLLAHTLRERVPDAAIRIPARLLTFEPFDETVHRELMRLYAGSGRRSAALRQYEDCVETLGRELGIEPEPETRELYRRLLLSQRPGASGLPATTPGPPTARLPSKRISVSSPGTPPLVGREAELAWLDRLHQRALRGQPQFGLVIGEAGIGKSRLVLELAARGQQRRAEVLLGRGREGEDILAFAPWVEALRGALGEDLLGRLAPATRHDLARLFPEIADGRIPAPSGIEEGARIFEAVVRVLRELTASHPLVVVIEDLHWCDDMTLRLMKFLPRRLDGLPVLLVGTVRPEETASGGDRGALLEALCLAPSWTTTTLGPLSRDSAARLFRVLLSSREGGPPAALTERVWAVSEGNPFVVVECARAVRDRAGDVSGSIEVPEPVRALTARSLGRLGACARSLADVAAVIGRDFEVAVLRRAVGFTEPEVADGVEELVRRCVLHEVEGRFDFRHDRVREVAYARLLGPRRALLHRQVAQALEMVYADDLEPHCAAIGAHYHHAAVWPRACEYQARAGFQAHARGASREALACFGDALKALARSGAPDTEERRELGVRMHLAVNGALASTGEVERGRRHLHEAQQLALTLPDRRWEGRAAAALSRSYRACGPLERALGFGQRALEIARVAGDHGLESAARFVLGQTEHNLGNHRRSLEHLATLLGEDTRDPNLVGLTSLRSQARYWMVFNHVLLGDFGVALRLIEESCRESDTESDPVGPERLLAHLSLGNLYSETGDAGAAVQALEAAFAVYCEEYHGNWYWRLAWGLGRAYARAGRVRAGLELLEQAESVARRTSPNAFKPFRLCHLGEALMQAGRIDEAGRATQEALRLASESGSGEEVVYAHWLLAELARSRNPIAEAEMEGQLLVALALAERYGRRPLAARCHLRLAWLYKRGGRSERESHRATVAALLEQMGGHFKLDPVDEEALA